MELIDSLISEYKEKQGKKSKLRNEIKPLKEFEASFKNEENKLKANAKSFESSLKEIKWNGKTRKDFDKLAKEVNNQCKDKKTGIKTTLESLS